jgi:hypothetical protein
VEVTLWADPSPPKINPASFFGEWQQINTQLEGQGLTQEQIVMHFTVDAADAYCPALREQLKQMYQNS